MSRTPENENLSRQTYQDERHQQQRAYQSAQTDVGQFNKNISTLDKGGEVAETAPVSSKQSHCLGTVTMPVGALPLARNGEPERGERLPVVGSTEKAEMVLSTLFATYKNAPVGSNASPNGC
jgi:hypothetical protein